VAVNLKQLPARHQDRSQNHNLGSPGSSSDTCESERHDHQDVLAHIQPESRRSVIAKGNPTHPGPMRMSLKVRPRQDFSGYDSQRRRQPRQFPFTRFGQQTIAPHASSLAAEAQNPRAPSAIFPRLRPASRQVTWLLSVGFAILTPNVCLFTILGLAMGLVCQLPQVGKLVNVLG